MIPTWLHVLAIISLLVGALSALIIAVDIKRHPQPMAVMNAVWPISGLYAGPLALWGYGRFGRAAPYGTSHEKHPRLEQPHAGMAQHSSHDGAAETPHFAIVGKGAAHCGAGCTLGDILAEWLVFFVPAIAVWFGWHSLFDEKIFAVWILDFIVAFGFGIAFQYHAIKPMSDLSPSQVLIAAIKADTLSLTAWQVGMYGFMAIAHFGLFAGLLGAALDVNSAEFWFMMQIAMVCGFMTAYPVNAWLIRKGIKEAM
ncbi:DUF4396 domain-containing protein [Jiella sp. MQZ9-1]|uniref:DUF4396 domain-containing protein n=1 Tax=Jiella flava TaxID=2816857 RepID=A0A939FX50_9HYPH|nr:DUF4396 domain-containing protein [Jiella flava]MBO0662371.1 DUF4396 domain-containing protein [Jiella flava]MCD2470798.1 DUF4396 domain-containing protein [Jiella flava]